MNNASIDIRRHYNDSRCKVITLHKIDKKFCKQQLNNYGSNIYWLLEEGPTYYYIVYINRKKYE